MNDFKFMDNKINVTSLPGSPAQEGTDATGVSMPSGGLGIRGWLVLQRNLILDTQKHV